MRYRDDECSLQRYAEVVQQLGQAFVRSNGVVRLTLIDGRKIQGRYYGLQCTGNNASKLSCSASIGDETGDYPGIYDLLDIVTVEPIISNGELCKQN